MALDSKNNIKSVFVVNTALSAVTSGTITPGSTNGGVAGSVVIANMSNQVLTASTVLNYDKIKIIKDRGANNPLQQVVLDLAAVKAYVGAAGKAAVEQVDYIGYNGTSGNMDNPSGASPAVSKFYLIKLEHVPNAFAYGKRPANYKYGTYQAPATDTSKEVALGLVNSLIANFRPNRTTDWRVFTELTASGTRAATTATGVVTLTFTKYSKTVVASAATASTNAVAGTYISLGSGTSLGVYKVIARAASGNLTLEYPFQGETTTVTGASTSFIATATGSFGIKITGIKQKYDVNRWRQYDKVRFNTFLEGFSTATVTNSVAAFDGTAVYEQVANDEYISWGDEGQVFVDQVPPLFREQDAVIGTQYNPVVLGWLDKLPSLIGAGENKGQAILYMSGSATVPNQGATLITVLDAWLLQVGFPNLPSPLV
jgi:hypothetical protein